MTLGETKRPTHFLSVDDLTVEQYESIFRNSHHIKASWYDPENSFSRSGNGKSVSLLFAEPSTRTSMSFEKAAQALGCRTSTLHINASSIAKGESYQDTLCMAALRSDILVARHGGTEGTLRLIADTVIPRNRELARVSLINGGEGTGEHPTQALLDIFTIDEHFGRKDVHIGLMGDLRYGRTCHSLIKLAARFGAKFSCIAPSEELQMPGEYLSFAEGFGEKPVCTTNILDVIEGLDVLYVTRLQRERYPDELHHRYDEQVSGYSVTPELLRLLPESSILMHPLPRLDELSPECDTDPRAKYITQADNGIITRMALIQHCLAGSLMHLNHP